MSMTADTDPIAVLERELVAAAARQSARPMANPGSAIPGPARPTPTRLRQRLTLSAMVAAVIVPVIAVAALALTRTGSAGSTAAHSRADGPTLLSVLGVLRRPRGPADVLPRSLRPLTGLGQTSSEAQQGVPDLAHARWATTTSWGARVYLVPRSPLSAAAAAHLSPPLTAQWRRSVAEGQTLGILTAQEGATGIPAADVLNGTGMVTSIVAPGTLRTIQVVPDGVAWVRFEIRAPQGYAGPRRPLVEVRHNVAALELLGAGAADVAGTTWYGARGRVIARHLVPSVAAPAPPSGDDLPTILGVLRRPQTVTDRTLPELRHGFDPGLGTPDRAEARLATTTPWGQRVYLVPFTTPTGPGQILDVFGMGGPQTAGGVAGFSAAQIDTGQAVLSQGVNGGRRRRGGVRLLVLVPDRVRRILVAVANASSPVGEAHGNVVALLLPPRPVPGHGQITWLDARGHSIASFPWTLTTR